MSSGGGTHELDCCNMETAQLITTGFLGVTPCRPVTVQGRDIASKQLMETYCSEDRVVDGRIILKWLLKTQNAEFRSPPMTSSGGLS
jgi:hypothetical protein